MIGLFSIISFLIILFNIVTTLELKFHIFIFIIRKGKIKKIQFNGILNIIGSKIQNMFIIIFFCYSS